MGGFHNFMVDWSPVRERLGQTGHWEGQMIAEVCSMPDLTYLLNVCLWWAWTHMPSCWHIYWARLHSILFSMADICEMGAYFKLVVYIYKYVQHWKSVKCVLILSRYHMALYAMYCSTTEICQMCDWCELRHNFEREWQKFQTPEFKPLYSFWFSLS